MAGWENRRQNQATDMTPHPIRESFGFSNYLAKQ
jgi:hypothetical protein